MKSRIYIHYKYFLREIMQTSTLNHVLSHLPKHSLLEATSSYADAQLSTSISDLPLRSEVSWNASKFKDSELKHEMPSPDSRMLSSS